MKRVVPIIMILSGLLLPVMGEDINRMEIELDPIYQSVLPPTGDQVTRTGEGIGIQALEKSPANTQAILSRVYDSEWNLHPTARDHILGLYAAYGIDLERPTLIPGDLLPRENLLKEAVIKTRQSFIRGNKIDEFMDYTRNGRVATQKHSYIREPVIIYQLYDPTHPNVYNGPIYCFIYDQHPRYGVIREALLNTPVGISVESFQVSYTSSASNSTLSPGRPCIYYLSKDETKNYLDRRYNARMLQEPIAALIPTDVHRLRSVEISWLWYCIIDRGQGSEELLVHPQIIHYKEDQPLYDQLTARGEGWYYNHIRFMTPVEKINLKEKIRLWPNPEGILSPFDKIPTVPFDPRDRR